MTDYRKCGLFLTLSTSHTKKYYNPPEHIDVHKIIVKFKVKITFRQYIPEKHKHFITKIYKLCDTADCTYDMKVYLGKDKKQDTHTLQLGTSAEGLKGLAINNAWIVYSDPILFKDLAKKNK
jgi:hypothetical protein